MKIWIDFINTPQVTFFIPFIKNFINDNHDLILTCRNSGNTIDLLKQNSLNFYVIGNIVGQGIFQKSILFPIRLFNLYFFLRKHKSEIAISQSSFYQPVVAWLLGIPCLYTNDNEHAKGNILGFIFATKVVLPIALQDKKFVKRLPLKSKLSYYPSVKEAIYLSQIPDLMSLTAKMHTRVFFRPEPWSAQYYKGPLNFFDDILLKLSLEFDVVVLPRDKNQLRYYKQDKFNGLTVAHEPLDIHNIIKDCLLFIGAGGSMTREMAVLELPVISIYQSKLLYVDKYLIEKGLLINNPYIDYEGIKSFLGSFTRDKKAGKILKEGQQSYTTLINIIYNLKHE